MEAAVIALAAFATAILTFFSGFGLGTLLTPVFMVFFPTEAAIALTAVVHLANNVFKLGLVGRKADWGVAIRFGVPAILAAVIGSWLMTSLAQSEPLYEYTLFGASFLVFPVTLTVALLLLLFAATDLIPWFGRLAFDRRWLPAGGLMSGFFGGLSGNQGALRSAFLIKAGLSKDAFVATAAVVSTAVDVTRLGVYATSIDRSGILQNGPTVALAIGAAMAGTLVGNTLLKKTTIEGLQRFVAWCVIGMAILLAAGLV